MKIQSISCTYSSGQSLFESFVIFKKTLIRISAGLVIATGMLTASPAISTPIVQFQQTDFVGVFGVDYPPLDYVASLDDDNPATTDYFLDWLLVSIDSSGNVLDFESSSNFEHDWYSSVDPDAFFPVAGKYVLKLSLLTVHSEGGLPECGPNTSCFDFDLPSYETNPSAEMNVYLTSASIPEPPIAVLIASGLVVLLVARRKVRA